MYIHTPTHSFNYGKQFIYISKVALMRSVRISSHSTSVMRHTHTYTHIHLAYVFDFSLQFAQYWIVALISYFIWILPFPMVFLSAQLAKRILCSTNAISTKVYAFLSIYANFVFTQLFTAFCSIWNRLEFGTHPGD